MKSSELITAGEFFLDMIFYDLERLPRLGEELKTDHFAFSLGGGAAITAAAAALLGRASSLITAWGDSPLDEAARRQLEEFGVGWQGSRCVAGSRSGLTVAVSTRQDRYFLTSPGANRQVEAHLLASQTRSRLKEAGHVHFALTPVEWAPFLELVTELQEEGTGCSWDLGWDPDAAAKPGFGDLCRRIRVLFLNEIEALRYGGSDSVEEAFERLVEGDNTVVIKQGRRGAAACRPGGPPVQVAALPVDSVDSTGAGDAFDGGFLHAWINGASLEDCLLAGNICGSLSTRSPGGVASLPSKEEFEEQWREVNQ